MNEGDKNLLLKDLCIRLPYGVKCRWVFDGFSNEGELTDICHQEGVNGFKYWDGYLSYDGEDIPIEIIKPYLRPMSSMTEEERYDYRHMLGATLNSEGESILFVYVEDFSTVLDWLNEHHFDYRGLIEKGLALEAPEGMYKTE